MKKKVLNTGMAMNLAGDYASACHHIIHAKIAKQLGRKPVKMVENHHNFAWKEMMGRKGGDRSSQRRYACR